MQQDIMTEVSEILAHAAETEEGRYAVGGHDEDYQFYLRDGSPFYVSIADERLRVVPGETERRGYFESTFIETDCQTLRAILSGKLRPIEAIEKRLFNMVIRMYEGCQITILLRIGGELVRDNYVNRATVEQILSAHKA